MHTAHTAPFHTHRPSHLRAEGEELRLPGLARKRRRDGPGDHPDDERGRGFGHVPRDAGRERVVDPEAQDDGREEQKEQNHDAEGSDGLGTEKRRRDARKSGGALGGGSCTRRALRSGRKRSRCKYSGILSAVIAILPL